MVFFQRIFSLYVFCDGVFFFSYLDLQGRVEPTADLVMVQDNRRGAMEGTRAVIAEFWRMCTYGLQIVAAKRSRSS